MPSAPILRNCGLFVSMCLIASWQYIIRSGVSSCKHISEMALYSLTRSITMSTAALPWHLPWGWWWWSSSAVYTPSSVCRNSPESRPWRSTTDRSWPTARQGHRWQSPQGRQLAGHWVYPWRGSSRWGSFPPYKHSRTTLKRWNSKTELNIIIIGL